MGANNRQEGGSHYQTGGDKIQHWDFAAENNYDYFQGAITKYVHRWKEKNGLEDLKKAAHYLEKYIEIAESVKNVPIPFCPCKQCVDARELETQSSGLFCEYCDDADGNGCSVCRPRDPSY